MGRRSKLTFLQRPDRWEKKNMKIYSSSLIIREMQVKITMRYHLTSVRMATIRNSTNTKC